MPVSDVWIKGIGEKRGAPHVFLDASQAARAGFNPREKFSVTVEGNRLTLTKCADGTKTVSRRVRGDKEYPVIDLNSKEDLAIFEGMSAVRVVVTEDKVHLLPLASEIKKVERYRRIKQKLENNEPLNTASLSHGGGVLTHAIHQGLKDAGIQANLTFVNELRDDLIEQARAHNDAWSDKTAALAVPMQEAVQDDWLLSTLPKLEILEMGLPCSGASKAGVAKRGLTKMEDHPEVGHLVHSALVILNKVQPCLVLLENVREYANSASAQILRYHLRDMGYDTHEAIISGKDFGCLEDRVRWCLVAVTKGLTFDFKDIQPTVTIVKKLESALDPAIAEDDPRWRSVEYLKQKEARDAEKGSNFKMQFITPGDTSIPTIRKAYHKGGSPDPRLRHPTNPELSRLLTPVEIAAVKGIPPELIEGMSATGAIQLMGQAIVYEPFRRIGKHIGDHLRAVIDMPQDESALAAESEASLRQDRCVG